MHKLLLQFLYLFIFYFTSLQFIFAQNYCDSLEISITSQTSTSVTFSTNITNFNFPGSIYYDWTLTDESGVVLNVNWAAVPTF